MGGMQSLGDDVGKQVVATLAALQGSRTDAEMGALIGCGRVHWWSLKNGRRRMTYALAKQAGASFPEVLRILMRDLSEPVEAAS